MKTLIPMIPLVAALALFEGTVLRGEEAVGQNSQDLQKAIRDVAVSTQQAVMDANKQFEDAQRQFELVTGQFDAAANQYERLLQAVPPNPPVPKDPNEPFGLAMQKIFNRRTSGGPEKALVVRSTDTDPAAQSNLEEDLAVMLRVFDNATEGVRGNKPARNVLGVTVYFSGNSAPNRSLYLDGYGALFLIRVDFPLLAPPAAKDEPKERPPTDSSWEAAKRELYGAPSDGNVFVKETDEYDADKVTALKNSLLEAFKSAVNIRNLKPDDSITVCVFGGAGQRVIERKAVDLMRADSKQLPNVVSIENAPGRGSILTMRAKKSDVDAFAKGKLNTEEFRRKTAQTIYQGGGMGMW